MDLRSDPVEIISFIVLGFLLIAIITIAQIDSQDDHDFMTDPNSCQECHIGNPVFGETDYKNLSFVDDIVTICHKCHSEESLGRSHPVNVTPPYEMDIPEDLHLDEYMNMTCATCHNPHADTYTRLKPTDFDSPIRGRRDEVYKSYYLRRTNIANALCYACHKR